MARESLANQLSWSKRSRATQRFLDAGILAQNAREGLKPGLAECDLSSDTPRYDETILVQGYRFTASTLSNEAETEDVISSRMPPEANSSAAIGEA